MSTCAMKNSGIALWTTITFTAASERSPVSRSRSSRIMIALSAFTGGLSRVMVRTPPSRSVRSVVNPSRGMVLIRSEPGRYLLHT